MTQTVVHKGIMITLPYSLVNIAFGKEIGSC